MSSLVSQPGAPARRQPWLVLALVAVAQFMVILDITIVNVALPSIGRTLSFPASDLQWVVTAYVLCSGGLVLVGGRAADLFGRRRMFLTGLLLFTGASLIDALAPSAAVLVGARAAQGTGAALLTPAALSILTTTYTGPQRATALAIWGAIASAGVAAGAILGGVLTSLLSWHWVFLVNVPVGLATAALAPKIVPSLPATQRRSHRSLDPGGALTLVAGLAVLVYALSGAAAHGCGSAGTLVLIALAAALLASFAAIERRVSQPLVPSSVWRSGPLVSGSGLLLGATGILAGSFFLISIYMQEELGWSALRTGLAFLPFVGATGVGVHATSRVIAKVGSRSLIVAGMSIVLAGALLLWAAPEPGHYLTDLLPGLLLLGSGVGLAIPAISIAMMSRVEEETAGLASGVASTSHEIGAALGTAVLSAIAVSSSAGPAHGSSAGFLAAAVIAGALAVVAATIVPAVRPPAGAPVGVH